MLKAISSFQESAWTPIHYRTRSGMKTNNDCSAAPKWPGGFTAFTSRRKADHISARSIGRRVRLNPKSVPHRQGELFPDYRHSAVLPTPH